MKTKLSRSISLALLILIVPLLHGNSMPMGKKSNFSGTWILNEQKSDFGEYGRLMASDKLIIVQKGKKLTMERYATAPTVEVYSLEDGGKSMVIKETASTEYGDMVVSFIYDLQQ